MLCKKCKREIPDDAAICPYCATRVGENVPEPENEAEIQKKRDRSLVACVLSVAAGFVMPASLFSAVEVAEVLPFQSSLLMDYLTMILTDLALPLYVVGIVLMIYARVRDKNSVFAKVLQWVYIVSTIITVIVALIAAIVVVYAFVSCCTSFQSCPG